MNWCSYKKVDKPILDELIADSGVCKFYGYMQDILSIYEKALLDHPDEPRKYFSNTFEPVNMYEKKCFAVNQEYGYWEKFLNEKLNKEFYSDKTKVKSKYDTKIFTFDIVIADALHDGPLTNYNVIVSSYSLISSILS